MWLQIQKTFLHVLARPVDHSNKTAEGKMLALHFAACLCPFVLEDEWLSSPFPLLYSRTIFLIFWQFYLPANPSKMCERGALSKIWLKFKNIKKKYLILWSLMARIPKKYSQNITLKANWAITTQGWGSFMSMFLLFSTLVLLSTLWSPMGEAEI